MTNPRFQIPVTIELEQLPVSNVPVRAPIDLSALLKDEPPPGPNDNSWKRVVLRCFSNAGGIEREETPIQFLPDVESPNGLRGTLYWLIGRGGSSRTRHLNLVATLETIDHAASVNVLPRLFIPYFPRIQVIPGVDDTVGIQVDGQEVLGYCHSHKFHKPFFYPVIGPAGRQLTHRSHPRDLDGRSHFHHRSLWIEHMDINRTSFETEDLELIQEGGDGGELIQGIGWMQQKQFLYQRGGPLFGAMSIELEWQTAEHQPLLHELRDVQLYELDDKERLIDFTITFRAEQDTVTFSQTSFGIMAVRVAPWMDVAHGAGRVENSEGKINERGTHRQRARWCDYAGPVTATEWNGIAILDHPDNPSYPTHFHVRDDGWMCAAPFYAGEKTLRRGEELTLRYRILLHRGDALGGMVDARQREYSNPAHVSISAPSLVSGV